MTAFLEATGITVRHPGATRDSVRDVHLSVDRGEVLCLAGPNGSGKSTTLSALARELRPREGNITLGGEAIWSLSRRTFARKVAHLPQDPEFPEGLTVEALVQSGRYPHTGPLRGFDRCDRQAVDEAIADMDLQHLRTRPMERLSGGERRRAWLAMVLCQRAEILLLDEPIASLDIRHRFEVLGHLARLNREWDVTMVIVLHELELAAALAHRIATFTRGRLYEIAHPAHALRAARCCSTSSAWKEAFITTAARCGSTSIPRRNRCAACRRNDDAHSAQTPRKRESPSGRLSRMAGASAPAHRAAERRRSARGRRAAAHRPPSRNLARRRFTFDHLRHPPSPEMLDAKTAEFRETYERSIRDGARAAYDAGIELLQSYYSDVESFDPCSLSTLVSEDSAVVHSLRAEPRCSLLFYVFNLERQTELDRFRCIQIDARAEVLRSGPLFENVWWHNTLFHGKAEHSVVIHFRHVRSVDTAWGGFQVVS